MNDTRTDNPCTRGIARFLAGLRHDAIPHEVRERVKLLILDSLGCGIYGSTKHHSRILMNTLRGIDRNGDCCVWGTPHRLSAAHAALVNGSMVQGFELDDTHFYATTHVGCAALPPVMAIAETGGALSGAEFIKAAVAGYEIGPRVGMCMGNQHLAQGWHAPATVAVFTAAAAAAAALSLDEERAVHAIGIAGTQSAGLMAAQYGSMVKRMNSGRAAQSGLYAGLLARDGYTGIVNVFESEYGGFCTTFSRSTDRFRLAALTEGLGVQYETMRDSLKFYSCAASNHTSLDAIRLMQGRRRFTAEQVAKVVVHGARLTLDHVGFRYRGSGMTEAQMNLPFCVATLLLEGDVFVEQFSDEAITDPRRMALADRVEVVPDDSIDARGADYRQYVRVEVHLTDGAVLEETVQVARGREANFAPAVDVIEKFRKLTARVLPPARVEAIVDTVLGLERLADARQLADLLVGEK